MKRIILFILWVLISTTSISYAFNPDQQYLMFLKKYEDLSNSSDAKGLEMYADDAKIHATGIAPDGIERTISMTGKKFKELNLENIELIKRMAYQIKLSNVKIIREQESAKITATKYSNRNCYSDNDYYMVVSRKDDKKLYITEEYSTLNPPNLCKKGIKDDLELQLSLGANLMNKNLPRQVDRETNFEHVEAKGKELTMIYRLIHFNAADLPIEWNEWVESNGIPEMIKNVCENTTMKELLDKGAQISLKYYYKDSSLITHIKMKKQDCNI
ncbi:hypothetical protein Acal01_03450 [Acinetobacter calcoaceticus]|uniref:hypothetical protein n=1 Tax=Acinetobacter calcoaceticus TaxID=471 RepID=UPI000310C941|nr:hypothetical protein [Acinetobacter calcoaceticus]